MKKAKTDRRDLLANIPLFSFLTKDELQEAHELFTEETHNKGEIICRSGEEGDTFYAVLSGELEVWGGDPANPKLLSLLGPDAFFGELALILNEKRSATVKVSQRARLLALKKDSFERFFLGKPKALEYFSRVISQRLASSALGKVAHKTTTVISVASRPGVLGKSLTATTLATLLKAFGGRETLCVRVLPAGGSAPFMLKELDEAPDRVRSHVRTPAPDGPALLDIGLGPDRAGGRYGERFSALVNALSEEFRYIVIDLGAGPEALLQSVDQFSDSLVKIVVKPEPQVERKEAGNGSGAGLRTYQVVNLFNTASRPMSINACEPFVLPRDISLVGEDALAQARKLKNDRNGALAIPLHRLARKVLGKTVGLALGGGAAFGLAHLGVLKVFEDNDLPIDIIVGCSMGSLVGVGYAAGLRAPNLIERAAELGTRSRLLRLGFSDVTISKPGFLAGDGIKEIFAPFLGSRRNFDQLQMPYRAVATDIESGERVAIGSGRLEDAFRASCSVPVVMSPVKIGNRVLVDGGVSDPVPADVVREMGADICVAVNIVPPPKKGVENALSRTYRNMNRFNPLSYLGNSVELPNMFDIMMNSMQVLQHELGNFKAISADVRINPDLSDFNWVEFYRYKELIQKGIEATETRLKTIKRAVLSAGA